MNETIELLRTRRSVAVRLLKPPAPSRDEIETMLKIASRVPDHGGAIPWRFIVIDNEAGARLGRVIHDLYRADNAEAGEEQLAAELGRLTRAPLVIGVVSRTYEHPKAPEWEQILSAGAACMTLVIAANALGYATNWHTEWYAYDRRFLDVLGLAPSERIAGLIHIGSADERPADRRRPELADIVTFAAP